jgi:hypothetical protein
MPNAGAQTRSHRRHRTLIIYKVLKAPTGLRIMPTFPRSPWAQIHDPAGLALRSLRGGALAGLGRAGAQLFRFLVLAFCGNFQAQSAIDSSLASANDGRNHSLHY